MGAAQEGCAFLTSTSPPELPGGCGLQGQVGWLAAAAACAPSTCVGQRGSATPTPKRILHRRLMTSGLSLELLTHFCAAAATRWRPLLLRGGSAI